MIEGVQTEHTEGKTAGCQLSQTRPSLIRAELWSLPLPATLRTGWLIYWRCTDSYWSTEAQFMLQKKHIRDGRKCSKKFTNMLWLPCSCTSPLNIRGNLISSLPLDLPVIIYELCSSPIGKQDSRSTTAQKTGWTHWDNVALHVNPPLKTQQEASGQEVEWNWSPLNCNNAIKPSKQASTQQGDWVNEHGLKCPTVFLAWRKCVSRHPQ